MTAQRSILSWVGASMDLVLTQSSARDHVLWFSMCALPCVRVVAVYDFRKRSECDFRLDMACLNPETIST